MSNADSFKVGEVAIFMDEINAPPRPWNGQDVLVLGPLDKYRILGSALSDEHYPDVHWCRFPNGVEGYVSVTFLRKKPPPAQRENVGEWELCPWRPPKTVNGAS